ncbi:MULTISPECIES: phage portal protein [unclassified Citromicrobium]|uniref:phage portal protein n=1 Tax=unclassified Citromicrobium TaxID=2630544 RepID=UPI000ABAFAB7|nr:MULTISPECIES: phage portal protein [unclassified Citromicrobium]|tara:strand:+ start:14839 stop:17028 length:2190 start_codon:yes stop_codon:yes gene_type:complete
MKSLTKGIAAGFGRVLDSVREMRHPGQATLFASLLRRTRFDYASEVGDGLDASVVTAPVMWMQRSIPEATLAMREIKADGSHEDLHDHDLLELMRSPNPFYGDIALWGAIVLSFLIDGNSYLIKVKNAAGKPVQLWWVPWWMIEPHAPIDGGDFIQFYRYTPGTGAGVMLLDPDDVVHFRNGINPRNMMKGLSPMQGVLREIFSDLESSNFIASLLRNMGVPGTIISPKGGAMPTPEDVEATKAWFSQAYGGDNRGKALVMGGQTEVQSFGFNPEQMNLSYGSNRAEERVCACIGIPAAVVGFGAGLEQTKVGATMEELRKLAWHNGVLPLGRQLVDELQRSLLPDFQRAQSQRGRRIELYWNTDDVLALQEDEDKQSARKLKELQAGAITLREYRTETGREADDRHDFYIRPINYVAVPADKPGLGHNGGPALDDNAERSDPGQKALPPAQVKHSETWLPEGAGTASEDEIARGERFVTRNEAAFSGLSAAFEQDLKPLFEGWGDEAARVAQVVLDALLPEDGPKAARPPQTKAANDQLVQEIIDLLNVEAWDRQLSAKYQAQYVQIARDVAEAIEQSGYGTMLPDARMLEVIDAGGTRAGLIDLDEQTRAALFKALTEGRAEGEGVNALANRIANMIEGGPFKDAATRAKVIARIETKHAQNISTLENGRSNGFSRFIVYDGRLGPDRSEPAHIARSGSIVSYEDAMTMTINMRPNCTLSFAPHVEF